MRGKRWDEIAGLLPVPSTPTHVGQTSTSVSFVLAPYLYPHARGANTAGSDMLFVEQPLPPTHVGQTLVSVPGRLFWGLYPHARGANPTRGRRPAPDSPLPPRTWGKRRRDNSLRLTGPSTPTHVGQTASTPASAPVEPLYPHARGANCICYVVFYGLCPLPPRTWGKLGLSADDPAVAASTPTHVGQTRTKISTITRRRLYPHARGANVAARCMAAGMPPLPPRTWGKRRLWRKPGPECPSTPTHVGQTLVEPQNSAGAYSPITRFSFTVSPPASSGTRHTPSKTTGPATTSSKTTVR